MGVAACDVAACTPTLPGHPRVLRATPELPCAVPDGVASILDDPARINKQIQGGRHAFVGQAINDFAILHTELEDPVQEIRCLQPWDGPKKEVSASTLQPHVRLVVTELVKQMEKRGLGGAATAAERINLVLDPRLKSCCEAVCLP